MRRLLVHNIWIEIFSSGKVLQLLLYVATTSTYGKYNNCDKNIELNINKTSDI